MASIFLHIFFLRPSRKRNGFVKRLKALNLKSMDSTTTKNFQWPLYRISDRNMMGGVSHYVSVLVIVLERYFFLPYNGPYLFQNQHS